MYYEYYQYKDMVPLGPRVNTPKIDLIGLPISVPKPSSLFTNKFYSFH